MDKKLTGLIGAAAALTTLQAAHAAAAPTQPPGAATSYRELLEPVPNALEALRADDARLAVGADEAPVGMVQFSSPSSSPSPSPVLSRLSPALFPPIPLSPPSPSPPPPSPWLRHLCAIKPCPSGKDLNRGHAAARPWSGSMSVIAAGTNLIPIAGAASPPCLRVVCRSNATVREGQYNRVGNSGVPIEHELRAGDGYILHQASQTISSAEPDGPDYKDRYTVGLATFLHATSPLPLHNLCLRIWPQIACTGTVNCPSALLASRHGWTN